MLTQDEKMRVVNAKFVALRNEAELHETAETPRQ